MIIVPYVSGRGGTEKVIHNLFSSISNDDIKLSLLSIGGTEEYDWLEGIPYTMVKISNHYCINENKFIRTLFYLFFLPFNLFFYIKNNKPDFIISTNPVIWFLCKKIISILKYKIPIIAWYHYSLKQHPINELYLNAADYFLAISSGIKKQLEERGIKSNKIFLIYNPIETDNKIILRPEREARFIYVGRLMLDGQKNLRELFYALANVKGNWKLDMYGEVHGEISNKKEIHRLVKELGISERINWLGYKENLWDVVPCATALVLTSKYEGLPMVLCEAISHGIYCVSSDIDTGPNDIIIDGKNGRLYSSSNVKELPIILQSIVNNPQKLTSGKSIVETSKKFSLSSYRKYVFRALSYILNN